MNLTQYDSIEVKMKISAKRRKKIISLRRFSHSFISSSVWRHISIAIGDGRNKHARWSFWEAKKKKSENINEILTIELMKILERNIIDHKSMIWKYPLFCMKLIRERKKKSRIYLIMLFSIRERETRFAVFLFASVNRRSQMTSIQRVLPLYSCFFSLSLSLVVRFHLQ